MNVTGIQQITDRETSEVTYQVTLQNGTVEVLIFTSSHPSFDCLEKAVVDYMAKAISNEELAETVKRLSNPSSTVAEEITRMDDILDGRMTLEGNRLYVDGDVMDPALEAHLLRLLKENDQTSWLAFARFVNKLYQNPNEHVRLQLFSWLKSLNTHDRGFTITDDGNLVGYKACAIPGEGSEDKATSWHQGEAIVNGKRVVGHIPNALGSTIEMPRSLVTDDPAIGCSDGLHVGTYNYAQEFLNKTIGTGVILLCQVHPRDIISVPTECVSQKVRCCRYQVLERVEAVYTKSTYTPPTTNSKPARGVFAGGDDSVFYDTLECLEGDAIEFTYTKADGTTNHYSGTFIDADDTHLYMLKNGDDTAYRSFIMDNISDFSRSSSVVSSQEDEDQAEDFRPEVGDIVVIGYRNFNNDQEPVHYTVEIVQIKDNYYYGQVQDSRFVKGFVQDRIVSIRKAD